MCICVISLPWAPPDPLSTFIQRNLCPERLICVDYINSLFYPSDSSWVQQMGRFGGRSGEKKRVGNKLCPSTKGHNVYQTSPFFMTLPLKVPAIVPSFCPFRLGAGKGALGSCTIHCSSPIPSHTFVNSPFIKLSSIVPNLKVSSIFFWDPG